MPTFANHTYSIVITIYLFIHLSLQLAASIYRDVKTFKTHILKHTRRVQGSAEFQDVKSYHHASETLCFFVGMACICMRVFFWCVRTRRRTCRLRAVGVIIAESRIC